MNWRKHTTHIVIALEVVLVMAAFAVAPLRERAIHADALRIARDMELVANSATAMYTNEGNWPGDAGAGQTPAALASSLPPGGCLGTSAAPRCCWRWSCSRQWRSWRCFSAPRPR